MCWTYCYRLIIAHALQGRSRMVLASGRKGSSSEDGSTHRADQFKRKGSPSEERRDRQKRARALPEPSDRRGNPSREEANGKQLQDHEKPHKSKKHRHGDKRSPTSKSTSPLGDKAGRTLPAPRGSLDQEAGEIDVSGDELRQTYEKRRPRSAR